MLLLQKELVRVNTTLLRDVCADYQGTMELLRSKVDDLESAVRQQRRQLKEANDQIKSMAGGL